MLLPNLKDGLQQAAPDMKCPGAAQDAADATEPDAAEDKTEPADPLAGVSGLLAQQLSGIYAGYQEAAGKAAGVEAGETWQVAFRAAVAAGASPTPT